MWLVAYGYIFIFAFLLCLLMIPLFKKLSITFEFMDNPGERKVQKWPIPLLGGPAIFLAFFGTIFLNFVFLKIIVMYSWESLIPQVVWNYLPGALTVYHKLLGILLGGSLLLIMGLFDDKRALSAFPKIVIQIMAAIILFIVDIRLTVFSDNLFFSFIITVLWVLTITNAFNFLDNMDGLSSGVAIISSFFLFIVSLSQNEFFISIILCSFMGALIGFLLFNFHPTKIYMGDSGSQLIGFCMASITIVGTYYYDHPTIYTIAMPVIILGVPIYDLLSVVCIRLKNGKPIYKGDLNHFSHRLSSMGMGPVGAVLFIYLLSFSLGLSALLLTMVSHWGVSIIFLQFLAFLFVIALMEYFSRKE